MVALSDIRQALADALAAGVAGLRTSAYVPGQVNPPTAIVRPTRGTFASYQQTMDGPGGAATDWTFDVVLLVQWGDDRASQAQMDAFLSPDGPASVPAALMANPTLVTSTWPDGLVSYAYVDRGTGYGMLSFAGVDYLGATLMVICGAP